MATKVKKKKLNAIGEKPLSNQAIKEAAFKSEKEIKNNKNIKKGDFTEWQ